MSVLHFIEGFYNPSRRHSALGYLSPIEYERRYGDHTKLTEPANRPQKRGKSKPSFNRPVIQRSALKIVGVTTVDVAPCDKKVLCVPGRLERAAPNEITEFLATKIASESEPATSVTSPGHRRVTWRPRSSCRRRDIHCRGRTHFSARRRRRYCQRSRGVCPTRSRTTVASRKHG